MLRWLLVVVCLGGCGKKEDSEGEAAGIKFVVDGAREDLVAIKAALASPKPGDAMFKCAAAVANPVQLKQGDEKLAAEIDQLCNHDLWAAEIRVAVAAAEAARKAKPTEEVLSECYSAELAMAQDEIKKAKRLDDQTRALLDKFAKLCPESTK